MKWQKARNTQDGVEFWVEVGRPFVDSGFDCEGQVHDPQPMYRTNVVVDLTPPLKHLRVNASHTELLPEFSDDVQMITWRDLVRQVPA